MAVPSPAGANGPKPAPNSEPRQAPKSEPKKPSDNTAVRLAPRETRAAVENTFGKAPQDGQPRQAPAPDGPAIPPRAPKTSQAAGDGELPPGAKTPDSGAKAPPAVPTADPKAAPGEPGSPVTDDDGNPVKTPEGAPVIYNQNKDPVPVGPDGKAYTDAKGNPYAVDMTGKYRTTEDGKSIVYANTLGGKPVGIREGGQYVDDFKGNPKVVNPDGTYAKTVDGKIMVYPKDSGGKITALDETRNLKQSGPRDTVFLVNPDGRYAVTEDGKYIAFNTTPDSKYFAAEDGNKLVTDKYGNPYTLNADGTYMRPDQGKVAVLNSENKLVASDAATGEIVRDSNGHAYMVDGNGKYMQPETGKFAVYNAQTGKVIATDGQGNPVVDANGNPYLVGEDGQYSKTADGSYDVYTPKVRVQDFDPVTDANQAPVKTPEGLTLYRDKTTGENVGVTDGGFVVKIDPATNRMVKDPATQLPVVLNDPHAERPLLSLDNLSPWEMLESLPKGTERGDPNVVKNELFKDGVLDKENLYAALARYDARDVYNALMHSSKYGGWDNTPKLPVTGQLHEPSDDQARAVIAAMMAWQSRNGNYAQIKEGQVPIIGFFTGDFDGAALAHRGNAWLNVAGLEGKDLIQMMETTYHELNHLYTSPEYNFAMKGVDEYASPDGADVEVVTEYLANKWTSNGDNSGYDRMPGMKMMDEVVRDLGGGDMNAGTDILKRAYLKGDPVALQLLAASVKKARGLPYTPPTLNPADTDPTRPPVRPNEDPETTLKNLPQGTERGDPMAIKETLFDENANLDVDKLRDAAGRYDPRDVYDALINSGKNGGWDNLQFGLREGETLVHPNEEQSRQAIAAIIAWQNENGKYNPIRQGKVPSVIFYTGGEKGVRGRAADNIYLNVDPAPGSPNPIATALFHEMNHYNASAEYKEAYPDDTPQGTSTREVLTEYLANNWSGNAADSEYERTIYKNGFKALEDAVLKMGKGDRNAGLEMLKRAYFTGEPAAVKLLLAHFPVRDYSV